MSPESSLFAQLECRNSKSAWINCGGAAVLKKTKFTAYVAAMFLQINTLEHANASSLNGAKLIAICVNHDGGPFDVTCSAYLTGFMWGMYVGQEGAKHKLLVCIPDGVGSNELRSSLVAASRTHPDLLDSSAEVLMMRAMYDAYKCKKDIR